MTDIHAHILPGIDDGAPDMRQSLQMAELAVGSGVKTVVATPHCIDYAPTKNFWDARLAERIEGFRSRLRDEKIPLEILPGMEIFGTERTPELLRRGKLIGLNRSNYPLIEFAFYGYGAEATDILQEIVNMGMRPIVAHPERYDYILRQPSILNIWAEMGCLLQINKGSLLGNFGEREQRLAFELVDRGFAFCVASDAHRSNRRTTRMTDTRLLLSDAFSPKTAQTLLRDNPKKIINNENIRWGEPRWFR